MLNKITKKPFQNVKRKTKVLELIHSDLCDLHATPSLGNTNYFVTFIDDVSRFCYVYLLPSKDEALDKFKVFKIEIELQQGSLIKRFRNDRGGVYMDTLYFQSVGIIHETTDPYTSQQNSISERKNRVLKEMVNSMLSYLGPKINVEDEPKTFDEAMRPELPFWKDAIKFDESGKGVIICLYVDDMLNFGTDQVQVDLTKDFLSSRFSMKDMGEADVILGIRIKHESNGITISQSYYIEKVLKKFNYFDCTLVSTPMDTSEKLMPNNGQAVSQLEYSRVIGCLMYAMTCIRPDIAFAVGKLSRYTSNSNTQYWQVIQRVLKYLKKTIDYKLTYTGYPSVLEGYTDASWISNSEDNSSTSGWVFLLGGGVISWASKKQTCITGSTMESKFMALATADKEAEWLKNLLLEIPLWSKPITPISIRCDSATTLAKAYS
ncbi:zinc finger, CCHC-type containing protein [Tanacetum coccineum]